MLFKHPRFESSSYNHNYKNNHHDQQYIFRRVIVDVGVGVSVVVNLVV